MPSDRRSTRRVTVYRAEDPDATGGIREVEYESVAEALHFALRDLREGRRTPLEIREDGTLVLDQEGIAAELRARDVEDEDDAEEGGAPASGSDGGA